MFGLGRAPQPGWVAGFVGGGLCVHAYKQWNQTWLGFVLLFVDSNIYILASFFFFPVFNIT